MEREIYCEKGFLEVFISSKPINKGISDEEDKKDKCWNGLWQSLLNSVKYFDFSLRSFEDSWSEDSDEFLRFQRLKRKAANDDSTIYVVDPVDFPYLKNKPDDLDDLDLSAIYLITETDTSRCVADTKGLIAISIDNLYEKPLYYDYESQPLQSGQLDFSWDYFRPMTEHNHNCLVIADLYISKLMDTNLIPLLDRLIPKKLDSSIPFQLSIFTAKRFREDRDNIDRIINVYKKVGNFLKDSRGTINRQFCVIECNNTDFHDRGIMTNNMFLYDTSGFDILTASGEVGHTGNMMCQYPTLCPKSRDYPNLFLEDLEKKLHSDGIRIVGDTFENRLMLARG